MSLERLPSPFDALKANDQVQRILKEGESLFYQNSPTAGLFYLVTGAVDLRRTTNTGHNVLIHRARAGETFAEASVFSETYHCSAIARTDSSIIECRRVAIDKLLNTDIEFSRRIASKFAHQIQSSRRLVELMSIRAADERIVSAMGDGMLVDDIASFADAIGLASETVYRALAVLTRKGVISKVGRGKYCLSPEGSMN